MIGRTMIAAALLGAAPAHAFETIAAAPEARIRNMADALEWVIDPQRGVYIRDYRGRWFYAQVNEGSCPRLNSFTALRFNPSPGGDLDRDSSIRADGWRCRIASVVASAGPPTRR